MGWPAVFGELVTQQWPRRNGTSQLITYPTFLREAYSGPTKMKIEQFWRKQPFDAPAGTTGDAGSNIQLTNVKPMEPMAMFFTTPMFNIKDVYIKSKHYCLLPEPMMLSGNTFHMRLLGRKLIIPIGHLT